MTTIGVIGCGKQAPKHISGLRASGVTDIVVADIDPARAKALASNYADGCIRVHENVDAVFSDPDIAAVSICTPTSSHAPLIRQAVKNRKHYLCEKPLCENVAEAEELAVITEKAGLTGMVGYIYRYAPAFEKAKNILGDNARTGTSPVLGPITTAFFRIGGRGSHVAWKHQRATSGGAINEMMVHMLDLAQWFFGPGEALYTLGKEQYWPSREIGGTIIKTDAEDWVLARMKTASGVDVLLQADFISPTFTQYVEILGENGSFMGSIQNDMPNYIFCSKAAGGFEAGKTTFNFPPTNLFEAQMGEFLQSVLGNIRTTRCDMEGSIALMKSQQQLN